jgi:hypothetical protein
MKLRAFTAVLLLVCPSAAFAGEPAPKEDAAQALAKVRWTFSPPKAVAPQRDDASLA